MYIKCKNIRFCLCVRVPLMRRQKFRMRLIFQNENLMLFQNDIELLMTQALQYPQRSGGGVMFMNIK